MRCLVCSASFAGDGTCPSCGYDHAASGARDARALLRARDEFRARTLVHEPERRVTSADKLKPWLGLLLGAALFLFWLKACSSVL
jgi:hypothetical protein